MRRRCRDARPSLPSADRPAFLSRTPTRRAIGVSIGAGRLLIGAVFMAAPEGSVRLLGLDTATARRVAWLARMTAARDGVLGAGTLAATTRGTGEAAWLVAGAVSDTADAVVLAAALRDGRVRGLRARAITAGAAVAAGLAILATADALRSR